jgi:hypothetical protein
VGGVTESWSVTTKTPDTAPNAFSFTDLTGRALNTSVASNTITISGIDVATPVSVTGDGSLALAHQGVVRSPLRRQSDQTDCEHHMLRNLLLTSVLLAVPGVGLEIALIGMRAMDRERPI